MILAATTGICIMSAIFSFGCLVLIGVILLQKGKGAGLSGAFGGGGGGQSAFGAKTGDVLTWVTVGLGIFLLLLVVILNWMFQPARPVDTNPTPAAVQTTPAGMVPPAHSPAAVTLPATGPVVVPGAPLPPTSAPATTQPVTTVESPVARPDTGTQPASTQGTAP